MNTKRWVEYTDVGIMSLGRSLHSVQEISLSLTHIVLHEGDVAYDLGLIHLPSYNLYPDKHNSIGWKNNDHI